MNIRIHPIPESIWDFWWCMCYILPEIKPQHHYYLSKLCHLSYLNAIKSVLVHLGSFVGDSRHPITSSLYSSLDSWLGGNRACYCWNYFLLYWKLPVMHSIAYTTLSQNLIGCSTLSQEYCNLIGWYWKIMRRQLWILTCPIRRPTLSY